MSQSDQFVDIDPQKMPANLEAAPLQFVVNDQHSTFIAEVAIVQDDLVFHFFLPKHLADLSGGSAEYQRYWKKVFPETLDAVAQEYFKAGPPRLRAAHVNELGIDSWWLRAYGFGAQVLDPDTFVQRFYAKLHGALESSNRK